MCEAEVRELKENCEDPMGDRIKTQNKESQPSWDQIIFDRDPELLEKFFVLFLIQQFESFI